jgi:hypothetical protein
MAVIDTGGSTSGKVNVDAQYNAQVITPGYTSAGVARGGTDTESGAVSSFSEIDAGTKNGVRQTLSPECDLDYRLRVAQDNMLDQELFTYTAQNTGKHTFTFTTLAATIGTSGITTNSGSITTTTTGLTFGTHAQFPVGGTLTLACETSVAFSAQPNANTVIDFGLFQRGASTAFAPLDGVYFRMNSAGMFGVVNSGGVETHSGVFPLSTGTGTFVYTNNAVNRYLIQVNNVSTSFWINNYKYAEIPTPAGANFPCKSLALPWSFRHAIVGGTAGAVTQALFSDYKVFQRGVAYADTMGQVGNRVFGSYQGLSGGAMGQLVAGTVTSGTLVKPTAAIPANTSLVANLPNSLGGRIYEQLTGGLAANVDAIFASYTVPAGSSTVPGRRLKVVGVKLSGMVSTVVVGGPAYTEWYIAFGHTADSLATTESASMASATTKAPRRVLLPELTTNMGAAAAAGTLLVQPAYISIFPEPIYVNPGERLALVGNKTITTAITSGVLSFMYQFIYSWE